MLYELEIARRKQLKARQSDGNLTDQDILDLFDERFLTEQSCLTYLADLQWGRSRQQFKCPRCNCSRYRDLLDTTGLFRCRDCGSHVSPKVGTLFQDSKLTLKQWFLAMWFMAYRSGMSALDLQKLLDVRVPLPFVMSHAALWSS